MNKEELNKKAKECFDANPSHQLYHQTNDGLCFTDEQVARTHARSNKWEEARVVKREDFQNTEEPQAAEELSQKAKADPNTGEDTTGANQSTSENGSQEGGGITGGENEQ